MYVGSGRKKVWGEGYVSVRSSAGRGLSWREKLNRASKKESRKHTHTHTHTRKRYTQTAIQRIRHISHGDVSWDDWGNGWGDGSLFGVRRSVT